MTALRRRATAVPVPSLAAVLAVLVTFVIGACGPSASPSSRPSSSSPAPSLTAVPGGPASPVVGASIGPPTTTDTDFGRIWDALPPSFPSLPGAIPTTATGPASGSFAVGMDVATASQAIAAALQAQGWTVDVGSPLEDGTVVVDAGGAREGCAAQVRFTPLSGTVSMSVLYGADCPFG